MRILSSEFVASYPSVSAIDVEPLPEFAFIGRSNAGKSSLLNRICARRSLAKVSGTPGKTRLINYFKLELEHQPDGEDGQLARSSVHFVDLPGYGYAKVGKGARASLHDIVSDYLSLSEQLRLVFLLSDSKRVINAEDCDVYYFIQEQSVAVNLVLTKVDKLNQRDLSQSLRANAKKLNLMPGDLVKMGLKSPVLPLIKQVSVRL